MRCRMRVSKDQILKELVHTLRLYVAYNESVFDTSLSQSIFGTDNSTLGESVTDSEANKICGQNFSRTPHWKYFSQL